MEAFALAFDLLLWRSYHRMWAFMTPSSSWSLRKRTSGRTLLRLSAVQQGLCGTGGATPDHSDWVREYGREGSMGAKGHVQKTSSCFCPRGCHIVHVHHDKAASPSAIHLPNLMAICGGGAPFPRTACDCHPLYRSWGSRNPRVDATWDTRLSRYAAGPLSMGCLSSMVACRNNAWVLRSTTSTRMP